LVARNRSTPIGTLKELARDPESYVRVGAAGNRSSPAGTLEMLASDPDPDVREGAAANRSTPTSTLERLLQDPEVAEVAADNPNLPHYTRALWQLATQ
jgi:hypothetical protein